MILRCDKDDELMEMTDEDSRQEWSEITYCCPGCSSIKVHRKKFDQNGLIILDEVKVWDGQ